MEKIALATFLAIASLATAQPANGRFRFAQSYLGLQGDWLRRTQGNPGPEITSPHFSAARIVIGGMHFWGRADFFISFPLKTLSIPFTKAWQFSEGAITGGRFLPFGPGRKWPLPFVGVQWQTPAFTYKNGPVQFRSTFGLEAGATRMWRRGWSLEASLRFTPENRYTYATDRTSISTVALPNFAFSIALKRHLDFTAGNENPDVQKHLVQVRQRMQEKGGLSSFSIALGPSSTLGLSAVPYAKQFPWLGQLFMPVVHPELGLGYYLHKPDMALRLSYRPFTLWQSSHGLVLRHRQRHIALEAFKFLFDFHGFVPFAGIGAGAVNYTFSARDHDILLLEKERWLPAAALVVGWDIRPTDVEWFILRTTLRYLPPPRLSSLDLRVTASQLEINFIQLVFYPERFFHHRKISKS